MTDMLVRLNRSSRRLASPRKWWLWASASLVAGFSVGAAAFEETAPVGLQGIWPAEVPAALAVGEFTGLAPSWEAWGQSAAQAVADFYKMDGDEAAQQERLAVLEAKLKVLKKAASDSKYAPIQEQLASLSGTLERRVKLARSLLTTLSQKPEEVRAGLVEPKAAAVTAAANSLVSELKSIPGGSAWVPFVKLDELLAGLKQGAASEAALNAAVLSSEKLAKRQTIADEKQKQFLSRSGFLKLEEALNGYLTAMRAPATVDVAKLRAALGAVATAFDEFEFSSSTEAAGQLLAAVEDLKTTAADGGAVVSSTLNDLVLGNNLAMVASEAFLSRMLSDSRVEQGQVRDFILGANVGGWQTTSTSVTVDVLPSTSAARFALVLNGSVSSNTAGATSDATIYTQGNHSFRAQKELTFDGLSFGTSPGTIAVNAQNTTTGATTRLQGVPIFGRMAQRIALQEAANRRPQSEAIAASRVQDRVLPEFNREVDRSFADASARLNAELFSGLRATGLFPDQFSYSSTSSQVEMRSRLTGAGQLGGSSVPTAWLNPSQGAAMVMHETLVNNTIDRLELAGKTMSEEDLRHHIEAFLSKALSREFKFQAPAAAKGETTPAPATEAAASDADTAEDDADEKVPAKLMFAAKDPIRVQFRDGQLFLIIRAGLEREGKDPIPTQEIVVPLSMDVQGDNLVITRDALEIVGIDGDLGAVERKIINTKIGNALPTRTTSAKFTLDGPRKSMQARISKLSMADGWIAVWVQ
jgi:hypothetical protein